MTEFLKALAGPSGGLVYHASAWRYRETLWRPYLKAVEDWLCNDWNPRALELIVFGSSAGWSLPFTFLNRFAKLTCVEPDPLARLLFKKRFPALVPRLELISERDLLPWFTEPFGQTAKLEAFLQARPKAAVVFSNLLGQVPLLLPKTLDESIRRHAGHTLLEVLKGREAASYHDLFSSASDPLASRPSSLKLSTDDDAASIAARFFPEGAEVVDHDTLWLSRGRETQLAMWRLRPERNHVIAFNRLS